MFKKITTFLLVLLLCLGVCSAFAGCNTSNATEGTLSIKYYEGGYGTDWIVDFTTRFTAETGFPVEIEYSGDVATTAENEMASGNAYDLYISHGMPIFKMAARGLLADLSDVYNSDIEGEKFEDRIIPAAREMAKFNVGGEQKYVVVPYTQGVGGFVYNKTLFDDNKWEVPKTYEELVDVAKAINDKGLTAANGKKITPFVWSNELSYMWDYVVCDWWAQMVGLEKVNKFFAYESKEVYNPNTEYAEFKEAYKLWVDLIVDNKDYSNGGSGLNKVSAQATFANGEAAMMPNAHWLYNEVKSINIDFEMAFMDTPLAPDAIDDTSYNYMVGFGDAFAVPNCAVNLDIAKQFLKFCARKENNAIFTEKTNGSFLAFDYKDVTIDSTKLDENAIVYVESIREKINSSVGYSVTSKAQIAFMNGQKFGNWPNNTFYYTTAFNDASLTDAKVDGYFNTMYDYMSRNWNTFRKTAGV